MARKTNPYDKLKTGLSKRIYQARKDIQHWMNPADQSDKQILLIMGCQRSGTSMLLKNMEKDSQIRIFGEKYPETFVQVPGNYRLKPLPEIDQVFETCRYPHIVVKPLVESQNALTLLERYPNAKVIWMYRHYRDVAASNLKNFGNDTGVRDLTPIVNGEWNNWRAEGVSADMQALVKEYFDPNMGVHDGAALFWYVRNMFFYSLNLVDHPRVLLCRYEDLVTQPAPVFKKIYHFSEFGEPSEALIQSIHARSIGKGKDAGLSQAIDALCNGLLEQLDQTYQDRDYTRSTFVEPALEAL